MNADKNKWPTVRDWAEASAGLLTIFIAVALVILFCLAGCKSATKDIAGAATSAGRDAGVIVQHAQDAIVEVDNPPADVPVTPEVVGWLGAIKSHLVAIVAGGENVRKSSAQIIDRVPDVENRVPWWASLIKLLAAVGALAAVIYLGAVTGVFGFIRAWLMGMGMFIPKAKLSSAKLDAEALHDPAKLPEAVASRRTSDPAYDAAFRKVKKE